MRRRDIWITFSASQFHLAPTRRGALPGTRCSRSRSAIFPPEWALNGGEILFLAPISRASWSHIGHSLLHTLLANLWKSLIRRATRVLSEDLKCFVHLYVRKLIICSFETRPFTQRSRWPIVWRILYLFSKTSENWLRADWTVFTFLSLFLSRIVAACRLSTLTCRRDQNNISFSMQRVEFWRSVREPFQILLSEIFADFVLILWNLSNHITGKSKSDLKSMYKLL